jgi:RimJ/RimL family protein N-acetyltransferase
MILETPRLILRPWRETDLDAHAAMMADPEIARFLGWDARRQDRASAWRAMALYVGHWALRGYGLFAVEERESGDFIGRAGLWRPEGMTQVEIGWGLARQYWGRGYATEAGLAVRDWALGPLGLQRLISLIHVDNHRSAAVAERLGMRLEAATWHMGAPHGKWSYSGCPAALPG